MAFLPLLASIPVSPVFTLPLFLFQPFVQIFSQVILFNSRGSLCTNVKLLDTIPISKAKAICAFAPIALGQQGSKAGPCRHLRVTIECPHSGTKERGMLWVGGLEGIVGKDQG